ncbi:hypothetical protein AB6A40_009845 [Gnathostoma spinigerum]|uniref:Cullin-5 n=1 Tax=Gnathostoma spinigerum TaxID=75299 RepID=A0ABD6ETF7_9BILA
MLKGDTVRFEPEWREARATLIALLNQQNVSKAQWQELFATVHRICAWIEGGGEMVRKQLEIEIHKHVVLAEQRIRRHEEESAILRAYIAEWSKYFVLTEFLPKPFSYIVETYSGALSANRINRTPKPAIAVVSSKMLEDWNLTIFQRIKNKLQNAAMRLVEAERNGEAFDPQLVIGVRQSYVSLNVDAEDSLAVYKANFERAYIEATEKYYKSRASQMLEENGVLNYMTYADTKLQEEEARGRRYLDSNAESLERLLERCVGVLVVQFQDQLLSESPSLIANSEIEKLRMLYRLLNRTPSGIRTVLDNLDQHIHSEALHDMIANASTITSDPEKYVDQLLKMFKRFSDLVRTAFYDDPRFLTARDKAFQDVVNDTTVFKLEIASSRSKTFVFHIFVIDLFHE